MKLVLRLSYYIGVAIIVYLNYQSFINVEKCVTKLCVVYAQMSVPMTVVYIVFWMILIDKIAEKVK